MASTSHPKKKIPTYRVRVYDFHDVENLNEFPLTVFTSKRFQSLKLVVGTWLYTFEVTLYPGAEAEEDPDVQIAESILSPLSREPVDGSTGLEEEQFPLPSIFRDFFSTYEHNGFVVTGDDLEGMGLDVTLAMTYEEELLDFDLMVTELHAEGKIDVTETESWFARDSRKIWFDDYEDSAYDYDFLGTTAGEHVTRRLCKLYQQTESDFD